MFGIGSSTIPGIVQSGERKDDHGMWGGLWILAIIALFFIVALVFFGRSNDGNRNQLAEIAALSAMNNRPQQITPAEGLAYSDLSSRFGALEQRFDTQNQLSETRVVREAVATTNDNVTRTSGELTAEVRQNRNDITSALKDQNMFFADQIARILENQNRIAREAERDAAARREADWTRRESQLLSQLSEANRYASDARRDNIVHSESDRTIEELRRRPAYAMYGVV